MTKESVIVNQMPSNSLFSLSSALMITPPPQGLGLAAAALGMGAPKLQGLGSITTARSVDPFSKVGSGLSLMQLAPATSPTPKWPFVIKRFARFLDNIKLTEGQANDGETKFKGIVSCLNAAYYGTNSETDHAFYIGSWAKKTRVRPPRDVDLYFLLPVELYHRFEQYAAGINKQSALLQEVKSKLAATYTKTELKGDGPIVYAGFWTFDLEVVPAFALTEDRAYWVPSTKEGGKYLKTMPLHEVDAINAADKRNNNNVRPLVRMLKCWQENCSVQLRSFYLELLSIEFLDQWEHSDQSHFYYDWMIRDFFEWVVTKANAYVFAPGTYEALWLGDAWKSRAETALIRAQKACDFERDSKEADAGGEWQKIFGNEIPKWT